MSVEHLGKLFQNSMYGKFVEPMKIERIPFPKEEVEFIISQIVLLNREVNNGNYSEHLEQTIRVLNETLEKMVKPQIILGGFKE